MAISLSVITTVKNEEASIGPFLAALCRSSAEPADIIVVDSLSTDGTRRVVEDVLAGNARAQRIRFFSTACNRARGRNLGVAAATQDVVVAIDAGCIPDHGCLGAIHAHFMDHPETDVAAGSVRPGPETRFEELTGLLLPQGPSPSAVAKGKWLPTSRLIAFRKSAFSAVGGYPEHASHCGEDMRFARRLREARLRVAFVPAAVARWRPRSTWAGFFIQYFNYAFGDGADLNLTWKYGLKLGIYGSALVLLLAGFRGPALWLVLLVLVLTYAALAAMRGWLRRPGLDTVVFMPLVEIVNDVADLAGYLTGLTSRWLTGVRR